LVRKLLSEVAGLRGTDGLVGVISEVVGVLCIGDGPFVSGFWKVGIGGVLCISGSQVVEPAVLAAKVDLLWPVLVRSISGDDMLEEGECVGQTRARASGVVEGWARSARSARLLVIEAIRVNEASKMDMGERRERLLLCSHQCWLVCCGRSRTMIAAAAVLGR
jgi:hypothetical protein